MPFTMFFDGSRLALRVLTKRGLPNPYIYLGNTPAECQRMRARLDELDTWARAQPGFWWRQNLYSWLNFTRGSVDEAERAGRREARLNADAARIMRADAGAKGEQ